MTEADFVFKGHLDGNSFVEFARHRARRLDLAIDIGKAGSDAVAVTVSGAGVLVDAFEMACSLGPQDCIVLDVLRTASPGRPVAGPGAVQ